MTGLLSSGLDVAACAVEVVRPLGRVGGYRPLVLDASAGLRERQALTGKGRPVGASHPKCRRMQVQAHGFTRYVVLQRQTQALARMHPQRQWLDCVALQPE